MKGKKKNMNVGAALLFLIFGLLFFVILIRFFTIQLTGQVEGRVLAEKAEQKYERNAVIPAQRGNIYDHKGKILAEDTPAYTLIAILDSKMTTNKNNPKHVVDPKKTAKKLAKVIDMQADKIYELLTKENRIQVEFGAAGKDLSYEKKKEIEALKLPGIIFTSDSKRFYPNGVFSSHLIGYAQKEQGENDEVETVGKMGIEKTFDDVLRGKEGLIHYSSDLWGYLLPNTDKKVKKPENGSDIYLTIDKKIQAFLEDTMTEVNEKYEPERMMAIVADPKTGKILAMGQRPTFHPMTREGIEESWLNELVETTFEPGSPMKAFTLAAAIEEGVYNGNAYFESGIYKVGKDEIRDHNKGIGWGPITYLEGIQRSSNTAFARLLNAMGTETFREYLDRFHFGVPTQIGIPNEASGKILYNYPIEKVTTVFGQGTTVNAIQMVQAMSAIANDGKMMKPYVVEKVVDPNDQIVEETKPKVVDTPISAETAREVRNILETTVTSEHGTGKIFNLEGYSIAGKTGTAQVPDSNGTDYLKNEFLYSFLGMAPKDDPKLIMYVVVDRPKLANNENGSVPVSMVFNPVVKNSLQYLNIKPEKGRELRTVEVPDLTEMTVEKAIKTVSDAGLEPVVIGKGNKVVQQLPLSNTVLIEGERIILKTDGKLSIPDMTNWSKRDVLKIAELADLKINMVGTGYVVKQNLKANSPIKEGDQLVVNFKTYEEQLLEQQIEEDEEADIEENEAATE